MSGVLESSDDEFARRLAGACKTAGFTPDKRIEYEKNMLNEMDIRMKLKSAEERGIIQGRAEGREEIRKKEQEIAKNLLEMGMSCADVTKATGLDITIVEAMKV